MTTEQEERQRRWDEASRSWETRGLRQTEKFTAHPVRRTIIVLFAALTVVLAIFIGGWLLIRPVSTNRPPTATVPAAAVAPATP